MYNLSSLSDQSGIMPLDDLNRADVRVGYSFESPLFGYKLIEKLGTGGYANVFTAVATGPKTTSTTAAATKDELEEDNAERIVAVKIEPKTASTAIEVQVLLAAVQIGCSGIPKIFDHGTLYDYGPSFISLERKGRDLYHVLKERPEGRFTLGTALRAGIVTLAAIEQLHSCGYISRDIKPGNFVIGSNTSVDLRNIYLVDFGLCKQFRNSDNQLVPTRGTVGWRGTPRYGSLRAHRRQDLSRADDVESWLYMLIELTNGHLPWTGEHDRDLIYRQKDRARVNTENLLDGCPQEYLGLLRSIDALQFSDRPNYREMTQVLEQVLRMRQIDAYGPMDWEGETGTAGGPAGSIDTNTAQRRDPVDETPDNTAIRYTTTACSTNIGTTGESIYQFHALDTDGNDVSLGKYKGKVVLVVNVASECGFTKANYPQMRELLEKYKDKGFAIAAFPCNQFNNEEPGTNQQIKAFINGKFDVYPDLYAKVEVNGSNAHPLWNFLKHEQHGTLVDIAGNFTKFLIDKRGKAIARYAPNTEPLQIEPDIQKALGVGK